MRKALGFLVFLLVLLALALTWLSVALGLVADRPETASNLPLPLSILPLVGSGFVPTHAMSEGVRQFAEYQRSRRSTRRRSISR